MLSDMCDKCILDQKRNCKNKTCNHVKILNQFYQTNNSMLTDKSTTKRKPSQDRDKRTKKRPMSVFDHSKTNWRLMWNDTNFDILGSQKMSIKPTKVPLSQQNTIDKRSGSNFDHIFKDSAKIQSQLESNLYNLEMNRNENINIESIDAKNQSNSESNSNHENTSK